MRLGKTSLEGGCRGFEVEDRQARVWRGKKMVLAIGISGERSQAPRSRKRSQGPWLHLESRKIVKLIPAPP